MARANVYDKQNNKKNKPLIIGIISAVAVILATGIICLILWACGVFSSKDENFEYFKEYSNLKITYDELNNVIKEDKENEKHTFVFVYSNKDFDAKTGADDTDFNDDDEEISKGLDSLIKAVREKKRPEEAFHIYLVDSSQEGNEGILNNPDYKNITEGSALLYFYMGKLYDNVPESLKNQLPEASQKTLLLSVANDNPKVLARILKDDATNYVINIYPEPKKDNE